jgi:hypothetical protein
MKTKRKGLSYDGVFVRSIEHGFIPIKLKRKSSNSSQVRIWGFRGN